MNAGQQPIREVLDRFAPEAAAHERGDRFVAARGAGRQDVLRRHAKPSAQRTRAPCDERCPVGGDAEDRCLGQRAQRAAADEKDPALRLRAQPVLDAQLAAQSMAAGFWVSSASGPASMMNPPTRSVLTTPPGGGEASSRTNGAPPA